MQSIRYIYKVGHGPSSSHTMGPAKATSEMMKRYPEADFFKVVLFGSLALTGKGHLTDFIISKTFGEVKHEISFDYLSPCDYHPNTLDFHIFKDGEEIACHRIFSVGGGTIEIEGEALATEEDIYPLTTFTETAKYLKENNLTIPEYVVQIEGESIKEYLASIYEIMCERIKDGLSKEGKLPGSLGVSRKAKAIYNKPIRDASMALQQRIFAYAYAVSEENASGAVVVTAPTCGACGVVPAILYAIENDYHFPRQKIIEALMVAGFIGNIIKNNASISGAEAGCQAEIGSACAMGAAACSYLFDGTIDDIEQSAEIALEHHLGLTCDPIAGYVQIPCIERNAVCALRANDCSKLVHLINEEETKITFDMVCKTMLQTGKDLHSDYRETAEGGLASHFKK